MIDPQAHKLPSLGVLRRAHRRLTRELAYTMLTLDTSNHDPGDEDRRPDGPWCSNCGDAFEGPVRDCPRPSPGEPYKDCGRGGHMFDRSERP